MIDIRKTYDRHVMGIEWEYGRRITDMMDISLTYGRHSIRIKWTCNGHAVFM